MPHDPVPSSLVEMIEREFAFLDESGFRGSVDGEYEVRYEHPDGVFVRVFRDPRDKYVGFLVGLVRRPKDALTPSELAQLAGVTAKRGDFPEGANQLHLSVAKVARDLQTLGQRALSGDETIFDEAMELRRAYTSRYTRERPGV